MTDKQLYEFNCLMLNYKIDNWNEIVEGLIDPKDVYNPNMDEEFGIEYTPHVTVLYGLSKDVSVDDVKSLCKPLKEYETIIDSIGMFECEEYDVLKFNVKCNKLMETNSDLIDTFEYYSDYDTYIPHMTIAYLYSGAAKKYCKSLGKQIIVYPYEFVYSLTDGTKETFIL